MSGVGNRSELRMRILLPIMSGQFVNIYIQYTNTLVRLCMYSLKTNINQCCAYLYYYAKIKLMSGNTIMSWTIYTILW